MKTIKKNRFFLLSGAIALLMVMNGCELFFDGESRPTVSLSVESETITAGSSITVTATATDRDGDFLRYTWYVDGIEEAGTSTTFEYTAPDVTVQTTVTIKCEVDDGSSLSSDSVTLTIMPSASLIIQNDSSDTIFYLYISPSSSTSWGSDQLGSSVIAPGNSFTINGIPQDTYDLRAVGSSGGQWTTYGATFLGGQTYTWTLTD